MKPRPPHVIRLREPWELAVSVTATVALIAVLVRATGRIYSNAVMRTGARVRLSDALRGA